jgi:flagellar hook-length control protein FliK
LIAVCMDISAAAGLPPELPELPRLPDDDSSEAGFMSLLLAMQQQSLPMPPLLSLPVADETQAMAVAGVQTTAAPVQMVRLPRPTTVADLTATQPAPDMLTLQPSTPQVSPANRASASAPGQVISTLETALAAAQGKPLATPVPAVMPALLPVPSAQALSTQEAPSTAMPMVSALSHVARTSATEVPVLPPATAEALPVTVPVTVPVMEPPLPDMQRLLRMLQLMPAPNAPAVLTKTDSQSEAAGLTPGADQFAVLPLPHRGEAIALQTAAGSQASATVEVSRLLAGEMKRSQPEPAAVAATGRNAGVRAEDKAPTPSALLWEAGARPAPESAAAEAPATIETVRAMTAAPAEHPIRELRLELTPAHLGTVTLALHHQGRQVEAFMIVDHEPARQVVQAAEQQVRELLGQQGLQVGAFEVSCRGDSDQQQRQPLPPPTPVLAADEPRPAQTRSRQPARQSAKLTSGIDLYA